MGWQILLCIIGMENVTGSHPIRKYYVLQCHSNYILLLLLLLLRIIWVLVEIFRLAQYYYYTTATQCYREPPSSTVVVVSPSSDEWACGCSDDDWRKCAHTYASTIITIWCTRVKLFILYFYQFPKTGAGWCDGRISRVYLYLVRDD